MIMNTKLLLKKVIVFLLWALTSVAAFWLMIISREVLTVGFAAFYVKDSMRRAWQIRFVDRMYFIIAGLAVLVFIYIIEGYLTDGIEKDDIFRRFARVVGIELLLLFVCDLTLLLIRGWRTPWQLDVVLGGELLIGAGMTAYSHLSKRLQIRD
jgi:hypothetical protein